MRHALCAPAALAAIVLSAADQPAAAQGKVNQYGNPPRLTPAPTTPAITQRDLQIRLYQFADDSMQGRQVGRPGNMKGTAYLAAEMKRLGLVPAGDNGTYFQVLPYHLRQFTNHSRLTWNGNPLIFRDDWVAVPGGRQPRPVVGVEVVFGGVVGDTSKQIPAAQAAGKFVVLLPAPQPVAGVGPAPVGPGRFGPQAPSRFADAVATATVDLDALTATQRALLAAPNVATQSGVARGGPPGQAPPDSLTLLKQQINLLAPQAVFRLTSATAMKIFGDRPLNGLTLGTRGATVTASLDYIELPSEYGRNVVAILPGSDPVLKHQYVALGAHNDHVGMTAPVDKDSLKAFNNARNRMLLAKQMIALTREELSSIKVNMDSIRKLVPKPRLDSINNGADDDGSGSMAVLEIAEALQAMKVKPKRSTIFVWHTGEEAGLVGSAFFVRNPTVPLDSLVAQINIDMVGRGRAEDLPGGGPDYLGIVGSSFDSRDLGAMVASVNRKQAKPMALDYKFDSATTWSGYNNIYGRSDHFNYAREGIPIAFFFTGLHGDYHQRTDEPEFIDYPHYTRITQYVKELAVEVGNGPRPRINGTRPTKPPKSVVP